MTNRPARVIVAVMTEPHRIVGYAIVSDNGMIADAAGVMPPALHIDADQKFLQAELDRAAVIVHGRHSHEGGPRAATRKRLVVTRRTKSLAPDPDYPQAMLWNPAGATLEEAVAAIAAGPGLIAVLGGTNVFGWFLPRYDAFYLSRAVGVDVPGGRPVFPQVSPSTTPEDVLRSYRLHPGPLRDLDTAAGATLTTWSRS
jgi:dihydrofolate reductase